MPTKSFKEKNWNKFKIRSSNKFSQLSLSMAQSVWFFNSIIPYHESRKLFHTVANLNIAPRTMASMDPGHGSFLTWILHILTNTFVITSTGSHLSNGNTKFVKRGRDVFKTWTTISIFRHKNSKSDCGDNSQRISTKIEIWTPWEYSMFDQKCEAILKNVSLLLSTNSLGLSISIRTSTHEHGCSKS